MNVLVTGGAGYIGSHAIRAIDRHGHTAIAFDNLSTGHRAAVRAPLVQGDVRDVALLADTMRRNQVDVVMHFAAASLVGESVADPAKYYDNNVHGTLCLLAAVRQCGVHRFVFSSSAATYGIPGVVPIVESHAQQPINPYGFTKLAIERVLADFAAAYGIGAVSLRYFNAAGAALDGTIGEDHEPETHLIPLVLRTALGQRSHVEIYGTDYDTEDGTCVRDYVHVEDLAEAHVLALSHTESGCAQAFNLGIGRGYSVREVIDVARRLTGRVIPEVARARRAGDPPVLVASSERIHRDFGWRPCHTTLDSIVESAWRWHESHPRGFGSE